MCLCPTCSRSWVSVPLYVTSGKEFDDRRNTSQVRAVDPNLLPQFVKLCADARARSEPWIKWIDDGCPELSQEEYEHTTTHKRRRRG